MLNILMIGDVIGRPGRDAVTRLLPELRRKLATDFVVVNAENSAHGKGVTDETAQQLFDAGADVLTTGNHVFAQRRTELLLESEPRLLRPLNYPPGTVGRGSGVFTSSGGHAIAVVNACGRVFMNHYDDPFRAMDAEVARLATQTRVILLDFHAEATSEKVAMGWHLDGRVSAVIGTHTHIPTADEMVLPGGTAYITDMGMTGPYDSVIGVQKQQVLSGILTMLPTKFEVAEPRMVRLCGVLLKVGEGTGRASHIERVRVDL